MLRRLKYIFRRARLPRESLAAVHDDDLTSFLASIGAINDIKSGKLHCKFCEDQISLDNLRAVIPDSGSISFICTKAQCTRNLIAYMKESNGH